MSVSSQQRNNSFDFFGLAAEPLRINAEVRPAAFGSDKSIIGKLKIFASADSLLDANDSVVLDSLCTLPEYAYQTFPVKHNLKPGSYYLFVQFFAQDTNLFEVHSNTIRLTVQLFDFSARVNEIWFSYSKTSDYNEETIVFAEIDLTLTGNTVSIGSFNNQWDVRLVNGTQTEIIQSFYRNDSLHSGKNTIVLEQLFFNNPDFNSYKEVALTLTSSYFSENYLKVPDVTFTLPLNVVTDIDQLNALKRKRQPYLTYGSFDLKQEVLDSLLAETLYTEAEKFYTLYNNSLKAVSQKNLNESLALADSAFAYVGLHRASSLLYVEAGLISGLYSGLFHLVPENKKLELNNRLGEAMKMADLMNHAYTNLLGRLLPDSLDHYNEMEKSGYFDKQEIFDQPLLYSVPVLWKHRSVPAIEHFIRSVDYESADRIIAQASRHVNLIKPIWQTIQSDTVLINRFDHVASSSAEQNDMLDFLLAQLDYYSASGLYQEGEDVVSDAALVFACSYQFRPDNFWLVSGRFYETLGNFHVADSLYQLADKFYADVLIKNSGTVSTLYSQNKMLLDARLGEKIPASPELANALEDLRTKNLFGYLDVLNDQSLAQKLAYTGNSIYKNFYLQRIKQLDTQQQHFAANEWKKDLAFFLGREGEHKQALWLYENHFPIDNLKATAFRLGFSEEAQLFYAQRQHETLSRYINLVEEYKTQASAAAYDSALQTCLRQVLFQHAFIMRGNFRLLYDVSRSEKQEVADTYYLWQKLREYLNELYVKGEPDQTGMASLKKYILETEKRLIRLARDTASMKLDYIPSLDSIRAKLKPGEAAIEMVRYTINHKTYYGQEVKYAALVVTKENPLQFITLPSSGSDLEGRFYKRYRNSMILKVEDAYSYAVYWAPLVKHLTGIKTIYWAPDGVYNLINLNTLLNPNTNQYVVSEQKIITVPTIANINEPELIKFKSATLLGNPVFGDKTSSSKTDTLRTSRESLTRQAISTLPGTATEVTAIANMLKKQKAKVTVLTKQKASKQALFKNSNSHVLHIATHGFWLDQPGSSSTYHNLFATQAGSGLILAGAQHATGNAYAIKPEGILTSAEIQDLNLFNTQLVVLSACETGLGEIIPGEGLYGLKRALLRAGAKNIITSLWKVDDEATMQFMKNFYAQIAVNPNLTEAFQQAMVQLKEKYPQPYYWGAFVLTQR